MRIQFACDFSIKRFILSQLRPVGTDETTSCKGDRFGNKVQDQDGRLQYICDSFDLHPEDLWDMACSNKTGEEQSHLQDFCDTLHHICLPALCS